MKEKVQKIHLYACTINKTHQLHVQRTLHTVLLPPCLTMGIIKFMCLEEIKLDSLSNFMLATGYGTKSMTSFWFSSYLDFNQ